MYQSLIANNALNRGDITDADKTKNRQDLKDNINQTRDKIKAAMDILIPGRSYLENFREKNSNKNIFELQTQFEKHYQIWLDSFNIDTGEVKNQEVFEKAFEDARSDINLMTDVMEMTTISTQEVLKTDIKVTEIEFTVLSFCSIIITLILGLIISKDSSNVLIKIRNMATRLSNYDFSEDLILKRRDEYGHCTHFEYSSTKCTGAYKYYYRKYKEYRLF